MDKNEFLKIHSEVGKRDFLLKKPHIATLSSIIVVYKRL